MYTVVKFTIILFVVLAGAFVVVGSFGHVKAQEYELTLEESRESMETILRLWEQDEFFFPVDGREAALLLVQILELDRQLKLHQDAIRVCKKTPTKRCPKKIEKARLEIMIVVDELLRLETDFVKEVNVRRQIAFIELGGKFMKAGGHKVENEAYTIRFSEAYKAFLEKRFASIARRSQPEYLRNQLLED